jgi:hypothetical protein
VLNSHLRARLGAGANANSLLDPATRQGTDPAALTRAVDALAAGLHTVFLICLAAGIVAVLIAVLFPAGQASEHAHGEKVAVVPH